MSIKVRVRFKKKQIIVPVRFRRALESEPPALDLPDVDERGFAMGKRETTWGEADIQGAMVAVTTGQTVRVRVVTPDMEGEVNSDDVDAGFPPLFAVSTDPKVAEVVEPTGGGPLPGGIFRLKGVLDTRNRPVSIQIHLGSRDGPIVGELEPHIFNLMPLRCAVHRVEIKGVGPSDSSAQRVATMFEMANAIWRHAGISFSHTIRPNIIRIAEATTAGVVTEGRGQSLSGPNEVSPIVNRQPVPQHINVYLVGKIVVKGKDGQKDIEADGQTFDKTFRGSSINPGILVSETADGQALGHELGHFLSLTHSDRGDGDVEIRKDFWSRRRLMFSNRDDDKPRPAHHADLGYGLNKSGCMITVKHVTTDPNDDEVARARRRAKDPF